jgi:hypothetical protein
VEAIQQEVTREVERLLRLIFRERGHQGGLDLEAVEMAIRSAMHQAGAAALSEWLPCSCGSAARYLEMRSKPVLTAVGWVELRRPYYLCPHWPSGTIPSRSRAGCRRHGAFPRAWPRLGRGKKYEKPTTRPLLSANIPVPLSRNPSFCRPSGSCFGYDHDAGKYDDMSAQHVRSTVNTFSKQPMTRIAARVIDRKRRGPPQQYIRPTDRRFPSSVAGVLEAGSSGLFGCT